MIANKLFSIYLQFVQCTHYDLLNDSYIKRITKAAWSSNMKHMKNIQLQLCQETNQKTGAPRPDDYSLQYVDDTTVYSKTVYL